MRRQPSMSCRFSVRTVMMMLIGLTGLTSATALASLSHVPNFPHTKVMMIDYRPNNTVEELQFMASHYDLLIGGTLEGYGDSPSFFYDNYYCVYVGDWPVGNSPYLDMKVWAEARGLDFESFFIHYAEETEATFGTETHILPAGSRVPTYGWYGSGGDLTKDGARIVTNPGNPNFRLWKLDYLQKQMDKRAADGVFVDNTKFTGALPASPRVTRGGTIAEYPVDPGTSYGNDLLTLFSEFKARFGSAKGQLANVGTYQDDPRMYPYVWGIFREGVNQPDTVITYAKIDQDIAASTAAGVNANLIGGSARDPRYEMGLLASFYLLKNETCYFLPFLSYVKGAWDIDPRLNQWFAAVAYDIGQPRGPRHDLVTGIDPCSPSSDTMTAAVAKYGTSKVWRLTDPSKTWADGQWVNFPIVFPSGFVTKVYRSGVDWIDLWDPSESPTDGIYYVGTYSYTVMAREFENALVVFRPKGKAAETGDPSAVEVQLPVTPDNPSGVYYLLDRDGNLDPAPRTSLSMRNTDGAILVKASKAGGTVSLTKGVTVASQVATYTIRWRNLMESVARAVVVEDAIPAATQYVPGSAEATGGRMDGDRIIWELGDLAPGATGTVSFQVRLE